MPTFQCRSSKKRKLRTTFAFDQYHNLAELNAHYNAIVHPKYTLTTIGKSHEGRDILRVDIRRNFENVKPKIVVDCGIHAREWASPAFCVYLVDQLLNGDYTSLDWFQNDAPR